MVGWSRLISETEMALFRNLCVNLQDYSCDVLQVRLTHNPLISLTLQKIPHFCCGNNLL